MIPEAKRMIYTATQYRGNTISKLPLPFLAHDLKGSVKQNAFYFLLHLSHITDEADPVLQFQHSILFPDAAARYPTLASFWAE